MRESNSPAAVSASREAREQARLKSDLKRITGLKVIGNEGTAPSWAGTS